MRAGWQAAAPKLAPIQYSGVGRCVGKFLLTQGVDRVIARDPANVVETPGGALSAGDVIAAAPGSATALVLEGGGRFDLSAPLVLRGIDTVIDQSVGDSVITLRDGLDLTLHLGRDSATVFGADNADTIIGGAGSPDTITLGSARESVIAGPSGATVMMDVGDAGARIAGDGVTVVELRGAAGSEVALDRRMEGVSALDVDSAGLLVSVGAAGVGAVVLSASGNAVTLGAATRVVTDFAGGNAVQFSAPGQTLVLPYAGVATLPEDRVSGVAGDAIDVDLPFGPGETVQYDAATGALTVAEARSGAVSVIRLPPGRMSFAVSADHGLPNGDIGTLISFGAPAPAPVPGPPVAPCFAAGTRVLTMRGWIAVEQLATGEALITLAGQARTLIWIGHRVVDCRQHPTPELVWPVRVCAGAFDTDLPERDVLLSPDHAVLIGGVLAPVRLLVNGATVRQEPMDSVAYFHLELASHDILLADGLPVESYLDTGNRHHFANGAEHRSLHADFAPGHGAAVPCARLVHEGAEIQAARARLLARADARGCRMTQDADLHVVADGQRIWGHVAGGVWSGWVPPGTRVLRVVSRISAPADCALDSTDHRRLGVALSRVTLRGDGWMREFLPDAVWGAGFYPAERDAWSAWRWSNADGGLDPALWAGIEGPFRIDLHVGQTLSYRLDGEETSIEQLVSQSLALRRA